MRRPLTFDFPPWLWLAFGLAILAIALPLAIQQAVHGEMLFACQGRYRGALTLAARNFIPFGGLAAYVSAAGWMLVGASGLFLCRARWRALAPAVGIAGFGAVIFAAWFACTTAR